MTVAIGLKVLRRCAAGLRHAAAAAAFAMFAAALVSGAARPALADAFTVGGIRVDVRAASAAKAREDALLQGQVEAFSRLIRAVVAESDQPRVPHLASDEVEALVADLSVSDEKASATRYIATLTVRFDPAKVERALKDAGVSLVHGNDQSVVLLGVYRAAAGDPPQLWEENNPWRTVLTQTAVSRGLFAVAVPLGDALDMAATPEKAAALDAATMDGLLSRYGADAVVVAEATKRADGSMTLVLRRYPQALPVALSRFETAAGDDPQVGFASLADNAVFAIARGAKPEAAAAAPAAIAVGGGDSLAILAPVKSAGDWVRIDRTLRALPGVKAVVLRASRTDVVQAAVQYSGDADSLRRAMERVGLHPTVRDGYWELAPAPEPATPLPR